MRTVILETERLALRVMRPEDCVPLSQILSDSETMSYYPQPYDTEGVREWIVRNVSRHALYGGGLWAMVLRKSGEVVGDCGLTFQQAGDRWELEVGYHVNRRCWGQGLATEAARACLDYGFAHYSVSRLIALIRPENRASCRVAEKNGMRIVEEIRRAGLAHYVYAVTRGAAGS